MIFLVLIFQVSYLWTFVFPCKFYFILLIIIIIFVVKALLVIRQDWVGSTLGEQGPHTRPGLVFRAVLGAQSRVLWARGLAGLLTAEATMEGKDSLGGFSAGEIMWGGGGNLLKNYGKLNL